MSVYAVADLHGQYKLYKAIQDFLQPEDVVYFLGDAVDRGPESWKLMKEILFNPQWIYLCGNHEDMLAKAIDEYCDGIDSNRWYDLICNGGENTFNSWLSEGNARQEWSHILKKLPYIETYNNKNGLNIYLCHAGFTPISDTNGDIILPTRKNALWNREHFSDKWDETNFSKTVIIHGHTPIPFMLYTNQEKIDTWNDPGAYYYCNDHKINIDYGACWIDATVLLNLDTFDEFVFELSK